MQPRLQVRSSYRPRMYLECNRLYSIDNPAKAAGRRAAYDFSGIGALRMCESPYDKTHRAIVTRCPICLGARRWTFLPQNFEGCNRAWVTAAVFRCRHPLINKK